MDDETLVRQFEDCTLEALPHRDHLRLVYLFTVEEGADVAYQRVREGLTAFTRSMGHPEYFHETRTWAWTRLVANATVVDGDGGFDAFAARHPELDRRDLLNDYYAPGVLDSPEARTTVVEPTLKTL